jgi:hypothetical protein
MTQRAALAVGLILGVLSIESAAETLIVPDEYATISGALDVAQAGDSVLVMPGNYTEEVVISPGVVVLSDQGRDVTRIASPDWSSPVTFPAPSPEEVGLVPQVIGFNIRQFTEYGDPAIWSDNPDCISSECKISHVGPADNWGIPCIYLSSGGTIQRSFISHEAESWAVLSTAAGAQTLVEDCIVGLLYPAGVDGFGSGSVTMFKNNTFVDASIDLTIWWNSPSDFSMLFINNIFSGSWGVHCAAGGNPVPEDLQFRFNCYWPVDLEPDCPDGPGNFIADPLLCDDQAPDTDYRLQPESPCIGAGENGEDVGARLGICWDPSSAPDRSSERHGLQLSAAWPNPTSRGVTMNLNRVPDEPITVEVLDVSGRVLRILRGREAQGPMITWDGLLDEQRPAPSGVYYLRLRSGSDLATRWVVVAH